MNLRLLSIIMVLSVGQAWCTNDPLVPAVHLKAKGAAPSSGKNTRPCSKDGAGKQGSIEEGSALEGTSLVPRYTVANISLLGLTRRLFGDDYDPTARFPVGGLLHAKLYGKSGEVKERTSEKKEKQTIAIDAQETVQALLDAIKNSKEPSFQLTLQELVSFAALSWSKCKAGSYPWPTTIKIIARSQEMAARYQFFIKDGRIVACGALYPLSRYIPDPAQQAKFLAPFPKAYLKRQLSQQGVPVDYQTPMPRPAESLLTHPVEYAAQRAQDVQPISMCDSLLSILSTQDLALWHDTLPSLGMQHFGSMAPQKLPLKNHIKLLTREQVSTIIQRLQMAFAPLHDSSVCALNEKDSIKVEEVLTLTELASIAYYATHSNPEEPWPAFANIISHDDPHKKKVIMPDDLPQSYTMSVDDLGKVSINAQ